MFLFISLIIILVGYIVLDTIFEKPYDSENVGVNFYVHEVMVKEGMHPFYWCKCPFCKEEQSNKEPA